MIWDSFACCSVGALRFRQIFREEISVVEGRWGGGAHGRRVGVRDYLEGYWSDVGFA
jgi:hypothetical protein